MRAALLAAFLLVVVGATAVERGDVPVARIRAGDEAALAYAAALAAVGGVPATDCAAAPMDTPCVDPRPALPCSGPACAAPDPARGILGFRYDYPGQLIQGGVVLMARDAAGGWGLWWAGARLTFHRFDLPGAMLVCADGAGLSVRAAPSADAPVRAVLPDLTPVVGEQFVLTAAGSVAGENGYGWYRISAPIEGWVAGDYVADAGLGDCTLRDMLVRIGGFRPRP